MEEENKKVEVKDQGSKKTNLPKAGVPLKTVALIILLAIVAGILVYVAVNPKKAESPTNQSQEVMQGPQDTTLSIFNASKNETNPNQYNSVIEINTGKNHVTAVQLELSYDPKVLTNVNILPGGFFTSPNELLKKIDPQTGRISYAISVPLGDEGVNGVGNLAVITYSVLGTGTVDTSINFLPKTEVSGTDTAASLLKEVNDGNISVILPTSNSLPTQSAQVTVTPAQ